MAADRAGDLGLTLPPPSAPTISALNQLLPAYWSHANPVDILGDASAETYGNALRHCLRDPAFDGVLVMLTPQAMTDADAVAQAVIAAAAETPDKPVLACWMGEASVCEARNRLGVAGIAEFSTPERGVEAFSFLAQHHRNRQLALAKQGPGQLTPTANIADAQAVLAAAQDEGRAMLSDMEAKAILSAFHIPTGAIAFARNTAEAVAAAKVLRGPVALKIASPQISHKTEVDGVKLNLTTQAEVEQAFTDITTRAATLRPGAQIKGVTVEPMAQITDAREVMIGASLDPVFGPTVMFGAGGTLVEVMNDTAVALPPLSAHLAQRLIDRPRIARALGPFRGKPPVDRGALVAVLLRVSQMLETCPQISALDLNPILIGPRGTGLR